GQGQPRARGSQPVQHHQRDAPLATRTRRPPGKIPVVPRITGENVMGRIQMIPARNLGRVTRGARDRRLRPAVTALEERTLRSTFTVSSIADDGSTGTLRWAVGQANASKQAETIVFSSLFDTPQTITLAGGQLELSGTTAPITVEGPGANLLTINGNNASRVFLIDQGLTASVSGLTITGGNTAYEGGGLENAGGLMLTACTVSGNSAANGAGLFNKGTITLTGCTVGGNTATNGRGGGLYDNGGTTTLTDCTV